MNKILLAVLITALSGCAKDKVLIKTVYVDKVVPVAVVPTPPTVVKPVSELSKLTPEERKDIGPLSKAMVVDIKQQEGYITLLEAIIDKYRELAEKSGNKIQLMVDSITADSPEQGKK